MKSLRLIALSAILTIGSFAAVTYSSCTKDDCKDVTCQNGGTCSGGNCTCVTGYEGTNCETLSTAKFAKNWAASDAGSNNTTLTYTAVIAPSGSTTNVSIGNFSNGFFTNAVTATVSGNNITISNQTPDSDNYSVSGTGVYDPTTKKITWSYSLTSPTNAVVTYTGSWQ